LETHRAALRICERYGYSVYDGLILASALEGGCKKLYSEDLQHGQVIEGLRIENPFL
jgi:predicted nucleic acid-binding protein